MPSSFAQAFLKKLYSAVHTFWYIYLITTFLDNLKNHFELHIELHIQYVICIQYVINYLDGSDNYHGESLYWD